MGKYAHPEYWENKQKEKEIKRGKDNMYFSVIETLEKLVDRDNIPLIEEIKDYVRYLKTELKKKQEQIDLLESELQDESY